MGTKQDVIFTLSLGNPNNYENCILVLNISLNKKTFDSGNVKITYDFEENIDVTDSTKVYFVGENNNLIDMNGTITNNSVTFNTNHFSTYIVVYEKTTNNYTALIIIAFITIAVISSIAIVYSLKKKKEKNN